LIYELQPIDLASILSFIFSASSEIKSRSIALFFPDLRGEINAKDLHCLSFYAQLDKRDVTNSPQPVKESMQV
jgi:hypothetical protein